MQFPQFIVTLLVIGSLILTGFSLVSLIWLILKDNKDKSIW